MADSVNHPEHYADRTSLECIDCMRLIFGDKDVGQYCLINAFKYLWRHKNKNKAEDIGKAKWYLNKYAELFPFDSFEEFEDPFRTLQVLVDKAEALYSNERLKHD